jgi:hypothetical protein
MGMYVARLGDNINSYRDLLGNLKETDNLEDISIGGVIKNVYYIYRFGWIEMCLFWRWVVTSSRML